MPDQEPHEITKLVAAHLEKVAPPGVRVRVVISPGGRPYLAPTDHPVFEVAKRAFAKAFGRPTVFIRERSTQLFARPDMELHDPVTNAWAHAGRLPVGRVYLEVVLLRDRSRRRTRRP